MRITLDWDEEEDRQQHYDRVRGRPDLDTGPDPWELRRSSTNGGYHYLEWDAAGDWQTVMELRQEFGDDENRIRMDMLRRNRGSPFLQVLYTTKYMERWGWQPESGNQAERIAGPGASPEEEQIKEDDGGLNYGRILSLMLGEHTQAEIAEKTALKSYRDERGGRSRSTISSYARGSQSFAAVGSSHPLKRVLRRWARSNDVGHYRDDEAQDDVAFSGERRRTIVEYYSVPWADSDSELQANLSDDDESEERLMNVHTGTFNPNHTDGQLKGIHDEVEQHARDVLSPANTDNELPNLSLDRVNQIPRENDSVNFENELLDADEARFYRANMIGNTNAREKGIDVEHAERYPVFEVVLWNDTKTDILWHVIGVWTGSSVSDATIIRDSRGWW